MQGSELLDALSGLQDDAKRLAFGAACCERMLPLVRAYLQYTGEEESAASGAQELLWQLALRAEPDPSNIQSHLHALENELPDEEVSDFVLTNCATNTVAAIQACLCYALNRDINFLGRVSDLSLAVLDEYISKVDFPLSQRFSETSWFERWAQGHPLIREELDRRKADTELLRVSSQVTKELVAKIRKESASCGIQPFRRGLVPRDRRPKPPASS